MHVEGETLILSPYIQNTAMSFGVYSFYILVYILSIFVHQLIMHYEAFYFKRRHSIFSVPF